jgi:catechol 2,3-dioxygenase-like lactoylglutathione lyase family enzyme
MTNESSPAIRFGMMVLYVRDLQRAIDFYRLLGLAVPDPASDRPVSILRAFDPAWSAPDDGYRQVMEFLVDDDPAVDRVWETLTAAGHRGIAAPGNLIGPYATMVADPDGNAVLVSNDPVTNAAP